MLTPSSLRTALVAAVLCCSGLLTGPLAAQLPVGWCDGVLPNVTNNGSKGLAVRFYYPAVRSGVDQPVRAQTGGYPVVVHLHGQSLPAATYGELGTTLAAAGFVVVMNDTAPTDGDLQVQDAIALFPTLVAENSVVSSALRGALDMQRAGLCGHSMGGGSVVRVLAANPGYQAGFAFAPWDGTIAGTGNSWSVVAPAVRLPLAFVHGQGDVRVHWQRVGYQFYARATGYKKLKTFALLDSRADHTNVVGLSTVTKPTSDDRAVTALTMAIVRGWFDRHLRDGVTGLESVVGNWLRSSSYLKSLSAEYRRPELFRDGAATIGAPVSLSVAGASGSVALYASTGTKSTSLPFGILRLDPAVIFPLGQGRLDAAGLFTLRIIVPNDVRLIGSSVFLQGVTDRGAQGIHLTGLVTAEIR